MRLGHTSIIAAGCMLVVSGAVSAGEKEDEVIDKAVAAYGGDALINLKSLTLYDKLKRFSAGQSHSPKEVDLSHYNAKVIIDFTDNRKEMQFIGGQGDDIYLQHQIFDGKKGFFVDHTEKTIGENQGYSFASVDRRISLRADAVLVKLLHETRAEAEYEGEVLYQGEPQDKITFQPTGFPKFALYLDKETGYVTKMTRPHWRPNTDFAYIYSGHQEQDGIVFASDVYVMKGGKPETLSVKRSLEVNPVIDNAFALPSGYGEVAKSLSFSEMTVQELAEGVYLAGQNWGFSIFVDAGDHYIAMGGYDRLTERLAAVHKQAGNEKPLRYQIVTHHHLDHLGGMGEAYDLGATFITVGDHIEPIRAVVGRPVEDDRFITVEGGASFAGGLVKVVDFPNGHSSHNLVSYIPAAKTVFTADYFLSRRETGSPKGGPSLVRFKDTLKAQGFDADYFAAAHSGRVLTTVDLDYAIENMAQPDVCPSGWEHCSR